MKVILGGLSVLIGNWQVVSGILFILITSQALIGSIIRKNLDEELSSDEAYSLGIGGWLFPASLLSLIWYWLKSFQTLLAGIILITVIILSIVIFFLQLKKKTKPKPEPIAWLLVGLSIIFIILRLAFISKTILPLYFDSAQHYLYIKSLTNNAGFQNTGNLFHWLTTSYYHLGFHFLVASITTILHTGINSTMLILGQLIVAIIPIPLFFIVKHETGSNSAGIYAVLLAGFGWYMPAYAVNWGKYPALASLPLIQFVLGTAYLLTKQKNAVSTKKGRGLIVLIVLSVLISTFFHSRSLVIFGIAILAWVTGTYWKKFPYIFQALVVFAFSVGIYFELTLIQGQAILKPLADPYINNGLLTTLTILFLTLFAIKSYPSLAFSNIVAIFLLMGSLFIPVTRFIPGYGNQTLLDRPFIEMILYLPLSLLGGLGFAGLFQYLGRWQYIRLPLNKAVGFLLFGLLAVNVLTNYNFYPSDCCKIVELDDLTTISWLDKNLPSDARILISTTELVLLPSASSQGSVGADAGIWILPLTGRSTFPMSSNSDFGQREMLDILCKMNITYIYVGETGQPFDDAQIQMHTAWYKALLSIQKAGIYQVVGCD